MRKYPPPPARNPAIQVVAMSRLWPGFRYYGGEGQYVFRGVAAFEALKEQYEICIRYYHRRPPKVFVNWPEVKEDAPHTYPSDGSLCLYKPGVVKWNERRLVAHTIVPWTLAWLIFYEGWLETGIWFGPEAPHTPGISEK